MPSIAVGALAAGASVYGARETGDAAESAVSASERATNIQVEESARQFDLVREDTRLQREVGNQALTTLAYLTGVRTPPDRNQIVEMERELTNLKSMLGSRPQQPDPERRYTAGRMTYQGPATQTGMSIGTKARRRDGFGLSDSGRAKAGLPQYGAAPTVEKQNIQQRIDELESQLDMARQEYEIGTQVPNLADQIFSDIEMPDLSSMLDGLGKDLENSRGYQFEMQQGREALDNFLSSRQQAYGGNAVKAALDYSQGLASSRYGERFNQTLAEYDRGVNEYQLGKQEEERQFGRLLTLAGGGPVASQMSATAGQNYASQVGTAARQHSNIVGGAAESQAAGNISAVNNIANTGMTLWAYNDMMDRRYPQSGSAPYYIARPN